MRGSLTILAFFAIGVCCGLTDWLPTAWAESDVSFLALCALMFCVGLTIGADSDILTKFRSLDRRMMLLPVLTILGTLGGSALAALFLDHRSVTDCLAVGAGMGYYSLSSIFITQYLGAELGTVALLSNIMREILTLLLAPVIARYLGRLAPISSAGATSADTTLPVITASCGQEYAVLAVYHGCLTDFSVPFLVTFFCSL
ncbi:MAG: lysine exporter LysO family protein [Prevotella sp.]|nr:lysine exporter LysO family protein [Prevotella sp.]MDY4039238.1 lysine exporter LysO family protein [Prevotella sp.]